MNLNCIMMSTAALQSTAPNHIVVSNSKARIGIALNSINAKECSPFTITRCLSITRETVYVAM